MRSLPRGHWPDGHLADVLVHPTAKTTYAKILKIIESGEVPLCSAGATMRECYRYEGFEGEGIWVPYNWVWVK